MPKHVEADALLGSPDPSRLIHALRPFFAMPDIEENAPRKSTTGKKEIPLSPIAVWPTPDIHPRVVMRRRQKVRLLIAAVAARPEGRCQTPHRRAITSGARIDDRITS
ncbi:hypothetical protein [Bradyrhizobium sp. WSM471]|uniref:hypothetical protein n=1 Tax=Bradyrhizobium sp. WSM471 TaxID=319017 RepID=UPI0012F9CC91|nr:MULTISPECIES: hypothetical protein [Bradyrhizobium]UFW45165.1 hypothetical protein BcanWSM471_10070 [Bradyrhizobium canariense]